MSLILCIIFCVLFSNLSVALIPLVPFNHGEIQKIMTPADSGM